MRGVRLPGVHRPPLPQWQAADQTERKRPSGGSGNGSRTRCARCAARTRRRYSRDAQPDHPGLGRLLPGGSVQSRVFSGLDDLRVVAHLQVGQTEPSEQAEDTGSSTATTGSSTSSGTTDGCSATHKPAPTYRNRPGPRSSGTPWSREGHRQMIPTWPSTGPSADGRSNPRWTPTPSACSPGRRDSAPCAGTTSWTSTNHPSPPRAGNGGSNGSPRRRSKWTTWPTTARPARRATDEHTSYTRPASGPEAPPGQQEAPWNNSGRPEHPEGPAWAVCAGTRMHGPEGAAAQQCVAATRPVRNGAPLLVVLLDLGVLVVDVQTRGDSVGDHRGPQQARSGTPPSVD